MLADLIEKVPTRSIGTGQFVSKTTINGVRPIYLTTQGRIAGNWYGPPSLRPVVHVALALPLMIPGWLLVIAAARGLDALTLGEETAGRFFAVRSGSLVAWDNRAGARRPFRIVDVRIQRLPSAST